MQPRDPRAILGALMSSTNEAESKPGSHMPVVLAMLIAVLFVLAVPWMFIKYTEKNPRAGAAVAAQAVAASDEMLAGERIYQRNCVSCHQARGEGRPGQYPSLVGASWLLDDKETPIRITLLGVTGAMEADGRTYQNVMPNFGVNLTDADIANVLTFARASWGNKGGMIRPEDVAQVRASLAGKKDSWNGGAALLEAKKTPVLH
ncbi:Cytochrome c oxidase polypeptide II [Minicystis rosea]|nr:Cytochrome c oxidase polypeptide II [Minicystis rosea]